MERMRKFLKFLSQRIVIVTFLIFLQIMWFVGMFLKVTSYSQYITAAFKILSILVVIYIMNRSDNPSVKLGWIVVILLFPLFGGLLYLTIGGKQPISYLRRKLEPMIEESARHLKADPEIEQELKEKDGSTASQIYYLEHQSGFPAYKDSKVDYYPSGEDCFKVMAEELRKAKEYIYLEYFIIEEGIMWNTILDILEEKVKEGVDVSHIMRISFAKKESNVLYLTVIFLFSLRYLITETIVRFLLLMGMLRLPAELILQMNILMKSSVLDTGKTMVCG